MKKNIIFLFVFILMARNSYCQTKHLHLGGGCGDVETIINITDDTQEEPIISIYSCGPIKSIDYYEFVEDLSTIVKKYYSLKEAGITTGKYDDITFKKNRPYLIYLNCCDTSIKNIKFIELCQIVTTASDKSFYNRTSRLSNVQSRYNSNLDAFQAAQDKLNGYIKTYNDSDALHTASQSVLTAWRADLAKHLSQLKEWNDQITTQNETINTVKNKLDTEGEDIALLKKYEMEFEASK